MHHLSPLDSFLVEIQHGLNTCFTKPISQRPFPTTTLDSNNQQLSDQEQKHASGLMRVNNAGEVAAQGLYRGQAITAKSDAVYNNMLLASEEENDHLNW